MTRVEYKVCPCCGQETDEVLPERGTVENVVAALMREDKKRAQEAIFYEFDAREEDIFAETWMDVQTLRRQCAELKLIFPMKAGLLDLDFAALVKELAVDLRKKLKNET